MSRAEPARPVYLDYQATTPVDPRVRELMCSFLGPEGTFGNPHSRDHAYGWEAAEAVRDARAQAAQMLNADDEEIVFTSGATESCNLALRGVARAATGARRRIVTVATEHPAVLETVHDLGQSGFDAVFLPVGADGLVDPGDLARALDVPTLVVSVMAANNEIGVLQPLAEVGELCRNAGALFHTDATQAAGRMEVDVDELGVDLLSVSSHKIYGPKGVGALFVKRGTPITPPMTGGTQEGGLRPGTVPTPLVAGFGLACELAETEGPEDALRTRALTRRLYERVREACPDVRLFGHPDQRIPGNLAIGFPGIAADAVVQGLRRSVAVSSGSACASGGTEPSRVLLALGFTPDTAATGIRISPGRFTTRRDIEIAAQSLADLVREHRTGGWPETAVFDLDT